jgi:hypothetical protein
MKLPNRAQLAALAERSPHVLNSLVAFFVMEWRTVAAEGQPAFGYDQVGQVRVVPNYIRIFGGGDIGKGINACLFFLSHCPPERNTDDEGYMSKWGKTICNG